MFRQLLARFRKSKPMLKHDHLPGMRCPADCPVRSYFASSAHPVDVLNREYLCPDCGCGDFILGPEGGSAVNIKCNQCGSKWWFAPPFTPERIDNDDACYPKHRVVNLRREFVR